MPAITSHASHSGERSELNTSGARGRIVAPYRAPIRVVRYESEYARWESRFRARADGTAPRRALVAESGRSQRHLIERFRDHVGLPPRTVVRILRFDRAKKILLEARGAVSLAGVAYECGYHDQAHFTREFRTLSGSTPTDFLARRLADGGVRA